MQLHERYQIFISLLLPNLLDLKLTKLMSCPLGEQTMLDYIAGVLSVMQKSVV